MRDAASKKDDDDDETDNCLIYRQNDDDKPPPHPPWKRRRGAESVIDESGAAASSRRRPRDGSHRMAVDSRASGIKNDQLSRSSGWGGGDADDDRTLPSNASDVGKWDSR